MNTISRYTLYLIPLIFCLMFVSVSPAAEYYVSPGGSDDNDGFTNTPWKTFGKAMGTAGPGDTVFIRGGEYPSEDLFKALANGGAEGAYLVIKAYPGQEPILNRFTHFGLDNEYTRVEGLTFVDQGIAGMGIGNQIVGNSFIGSGFRFAAIAAVGDNLLVEGNVIDVRQGSTQDHAIYVQRGTGKIIRNNTILRSFGYGIHVFDEQKKSDESQWIPFAIKDIIIEGNFISGSQQRDGIIVAKGRGGNTIDLSNIIIRNNIIASNSRNALFLREGTNIEVYNNTIYLNTSMSIGITQPVKGNEYVNNVTVSNNIIYTTTGNAHISVTSSGDNIVIDNNLYWPESGAISGAKDARAIFADPKLLNPDAGDFHISETSPAIDAGLTIPSITQDFEGSVRPQGDGYDIGADEFGDETVPLELASFQAAVIDNSVHLTWRSASEINNLDFEIQRRKGAADFQKIGFIPCFGNSAFKNNYEFWDNKFNAGCYDYRLMQLYLDGSFKFSGAVQVEISTLTNFELHQNYLILPV